MKSRQRKRRLARIIIRERKETKGGENLSLKYIFQNISLDRKNLSDSVFICQKKDSGTLKEYWSVKLQLDRLSL